MAEERQPPAVVEGATAGDVEDEVQSTAKSAEDRKAAAALAKLDGRDDDAAGASHQVDQEGLSRAMNRLGAGGAKAGDGGKEVAAKKVKVDPADVALLVDELDLTKPKATELLKQHDGDAVKALRAFVSVN
ncbi:hypothetical protein NKR23_g2658 [Pleurostoma richardsiae]|uniref:Nascent polypeptide-associated complex subunit alpha-like UBA domain-containing protein n=1 Tax=Pleurostoma richardsiae TaxID=41990 RepID=A0AA38S1Q4_9PEZI|nr:hypothetical protein NKR23_g2658 [Pleurostoma richardsiae]